MNPVALLGWALIVCDFLRTAAQLVIAMGVLSIAFDMAKRPKGAQ